VTLKRRPTTNSRQISPGARQRRTDVPEYARDNCPLRVAYDHENKLTRKGQTGGRKGRGTDNAASGSGAGASRLDTKERRAYDD